MKNAARLAAAASQPLESIRPSEPYRAPRYRVTLVCETEGTGAAEPIRDSITAVQLFRPCFEGLDREHFLVCGLDAKHRVIGINLVSVGTLTLSIVHPREVFKPLIMMNAAAWLASHNHPSGDATPSQEDRLLTKRLREVGDLLGITLLDHVILGEARHFSFADDGWP
ncbi:MAG: JAB domain-containing protein [Nitrospira sp.]|nr:JAB domain-containing protein [Nitrospira sp.]MDH4242699.1 JAB domain-containing protein [Nitrospira sp.]MDH4355032.1 JAB domain-containing protein [Nitrospira sp.]MDH5316982.1 JAB domain-containing protein [Nitrospira sp.]